MTWSISFTVDQGKVDPDTLQVYGTPPDGTITVSGYRSDQGRSVGVAAAGAHVSGYFPNRPTGEPDAAAAGDQPPPEQPSG